jgi:hypothetical protein
VWDADVGVEWTVNIHRLEFGCNSVVWSVCKVCLYAHRWMWQTVTICVVAGQSQFESWTRHLGLILNRMLLISFNVINQTRITHSRGVCWVSKSNVSRCSSTAVCQQMPDGKFPHLQMPLGRLSVWVTATWISAVKQF